jgi:hypothetical protein
VLVSVAPDQTIVGGFSTRGYRIKDMSRKEKKRNALRQWVGTDNLAIGSRVPVEWKPVAGVPRGTQNENTGTSDEQAFQTVASQFYRS